jgi:uncharacterized membrane protein YhaH (DUF805 family)
MDLGWLFFSFQGRINRAKYWLAILVFVAISLGLKLVLGVIAFAAMRGAGTGGYFALSIIVSILNLGVGIVLFISGLAVGAKRLHDRDKSAWWLLLFYVLPYALAGIGLLITYAAHNSGPFILGVLGALGIAIWMFVELGCLRGTVGPNRYGPDPLGPSDRSGGTLLR